MRIRKGFTLVEMLIVIAIIAVMVSITIPVVSGAMLKASAAANAANLRSVQSAVQSDYMKHPEKYGDVRITKARNEVLLFGDEIAFNAPAARAINAGSVQIPAGTQMMVRIQEDSTVIATYAGFDLGALGGLLGGGDISELLPLLPEDMLGDMEEDDIFDILEGIINGSQQKPGDSGVPPYDPPLYVDVNQLKNFMATAITAGQAGSDCVTCKNQNKFCSSYFAIPDANGKTYMCDVCGHPPGVHFTPVYMDVASKVIGVVQCTTGTPHDWNENHVCSNCKAEYPIKQHVFNHEEISKCEICGRPNHEKNCAEGKHVFNREGVCEYCGALPVTTGACECATFAMAGMYCANCGHSAFDHVYDDYSFGTCKFGH